jgi:hypothetical protein
MFHAFQHSFKEYHTDWGSLSLDPVDIEDYKWVSEGTAAAAEDSDTVMRRSVVLDRPLHPIDRALTASDYVHRISSEVIAYQAQDFWVHFARSKGRDLGLDYLKPLFSLGATTAAVDTFLSTTYESSLGVEYWGWAKNQAMEKSVDFDGRLTNACHIEPELIGTPQFALYPTIDLPPPIEGTLPRLTAAVVGIIFQEDLGNTTITARVTSGNAAGLAYKVYMEGIPGCADVADGERTFDAVASASVAYVILANVQHDPAASLTYEVSISPTPAEQRGQPSR